MKNLRQSKKTNYFNMLQQRSMDFSFYILHLKWYNNTSKACLTVSN